MRLLRNKNEVSSQTDKVQEVMSPKRNVQEVMSSERGAVMARLSIFELPFDALCHSMHLYSPLLCQIKDAYERVLQELEHAVSSFGFRVQGLGCL
jgi:hypothetical protein